MKTTAIYLFLALPWLGGCTAGTVYQVLGYDAIDAATLEVRKGIDAYDISVRASAARNRKEYVAKLKGDVVKWALSKGETEASAEIVGNLVATGAETFFANSTEQERRRAQWYAVTIDNLDYIREVCEDSKAFAIYRADVSQQWRSYLQSQARSRLNKMGVPIYGSTENEEAIGGGAGGEGGG